MPWRCSGNVTVLVTKFIMMHHCGETEAENENKGPVFAPIRISMCLPLPATNARSCRLLRAKERWLKEGCWVLCPPAHFGHSRTQLKPR